MAFSLWQADYSNICLATFGMAEPMPSMSRILSQTGWPTSGTASKHIFKKKETEITIRHIQTTEELICTSVWNIFHSSCSHLYKDFQSKPYRNINYICKSTVQSSQIRLRDAVRLRIFKELHFKALCGLKIL